MEKELVKWNTIERNKNKVLLKKFHGWQKNSDETITIDFSGANKFVFNKQAAKVWELINDDNTLENIVKVMTNESKVENPEKIRKDIYELISNLLDKNLVNWEQSLWEDEDENEENKIR